MNVIQLNAMNILFHLKFRNAPPIRTSRRNRMFTNIRILLKSGLLFLKTISNSSKCSRNAVYTTFLVLLAPHFSVTELCSPLDSMNLKCNYFPPTIPPNVTRVHVVEVGRWSSLPISPFAQQSWRNVIYLSIDLSKSNDWAIFSRSLHGVENVEELHITSGKIQHIEAGTFSRLEKLRILDLSGNGRLDITHVNTVFRDLQNSSLTMLNLTSINNVLAHASSNIGKDFVESLGDIRLKVLDVTDVGQLRFSDFEPIKALGRSLEVLNVTNTMLSITKHLALELDWTKLFPVLKIAIVDGFGYPRSGSMNKNCTKNPLTEIDIMYCEQFAGSLPAMIEVISLNDLEMKEGCLEFFYGITCIQPARKLKRLHLKRGPYTGINLLMHGFQSLEFLDLRDNMIENFTEHTCVMLPALRSLILAGNKLFKMERTEDFRKCFHQCRNLQDIDLSRNALTYIPEDLFKRTTNLTHINISQNLLKTLLLDITVLLKLEAVDVSDNQILTLDNKMFTYLHDFIDLSVNFSSSLLDISLNSLQCSCDDINFIEQIHRLSFLLKGFNTYECFTGDRKLAISRVVSRDLENECLMAVLKIVIPPIAVLLLIVVISVVTYKKRIYIHKCIVWYRFRRYTSQQTSVDFICFLAYCHKDKDLILRELYPQLNDKLKSYCGVDHDCVLINDKYFIPGTHIDEEIARAIKSSRSTVLAISREFLQSPWSALETKVAWLERKPIIMVFIETVPEKELPAVLRYLFSKKVRLRWPDEADDKEAFWFSLIRALSVTTDVEFFGITETNGGEESTVL